MAGATGRLIALAAMLPVGVAATADAPVQALAGRYSDHFENGLVDGSRYWSDDVVEIVPVDARHAYVRFDLQFFNGHSCSLAGVAEARESSLVYVAPADSVGEGEERCTLTIRRNGATLAWTDDGTCRIHCGARGGFVNGKLDWSSKRPITYLARLKASSEYRGALAEWRTGRSVAP